MIIGLVTIITGTIWVTADLYHQFVADTLSEELKVQITPLSPQLQTRVLDELSAKRSIEVNFEQQSQTN